MLVGDRMTKRPITVTEDDSIDQALGLMRSEKVRRLPVLDKHGKLVGTHLDGNNRLWAQAVAGSALDYVEAFTPAPDTDMSLADALAAWPDKVIWINFPSSVHLASIETIEQTTRRLIRDAAPGNRLIIGITEDIPQDRWQANMLAISRVIDEEAGVGCASRP